METWQLQRRSEVRLAALDKRLAQRAVDTTHRHWKAIRKWLRYRRLWWRYKYVYDAPYPPIIEDIWADRYSWLRDFRAGWRNPPMYRARRYSA